MQRVLLNWAQDDMTWNDTCTIGTYQVSYNLTGLEPSSDYSVYNNSALWASLSTDENGALDFILPVGTTTQKIQVILDLGGSTYCWHVEDGLCWLPPNCNVSLIDFLGACWT